MKTMLVISTTDAGQPEILRDENSTHWAYFADAMDGTFAVNKINYPSCEPNGNGAGVAVYRLDGSIDVIEKEEGDEYAVNHPTEFVVDGGEWSTNEGE